MLRGLGMERAALTAVQFRAGGHGSQQMPIFLDRHDLKGMTASDIAEAHRKDLEVQVRYGVRFLTYWFDEGRGTGFCLIDAPDKDTAMRVHAEAHGGCASHVIEVQLSAVEAFLGRISDPLPDASGTAPTPDTAFRAVMFTDIVDSTGMTARLGDVQALEMIRAHDSLVRRAIESVAGREIKHTGDGIMASFGQASDALTCACDTQRALKKFNQSSIEKLSVRIGIHAGEPVEDSRDLFGATVQIAARLCQIAPKGATVISDAMCAYVSDNMKLVPLGSQILKGFEVPVPVYEVACR